MLFYNLCAHLISVSCALQKWALVGMNLLDKSGHEAHNLAECAITDTSFSHLRPHLSIKNLASRAMNKIDSCVGQQRVSAEADTSRLARKLNLHHDWGLYRKIHESNKR